MDDVRFTSLFGGSDGAVVLKGDSMGAPEPCEKVMEGEFGPTLDLGLPCCERGRMDSLLIHDPFDEMESLDGSVMAEGG